MFSPAGSIFVCQQTPIMLLFSPTNSHRLRYMADFTGRLLTGEPARITSDRDEFIAAGTIRINYSDQRLTADECWIKPHPLLFETGTREQGPVCTDWQMLPVFFQTEGDIPFDIFAAAFYLISRYEEYLPHQQDSYGRYAHEQSLAYREGFLNRPVVDGWMQQFKMLIRKLFPSAVLKTNHFKWIPTYDIDEAYSFKYKSWTRSAGAALRDLLKGNFAHFAQRRRVLDGKEADPFDAYAWINDLHRPYQLSPVYFFLVGEKNGRYDKQILPAQTAMQTLIQQHAEKYSIGLHPSWQSGDNSTLLQKEKERLERISGLKVTASRQHYIRMNLPTTYRLLLEAGIREDYSMGYGSINGFRASYSNAYYWYDLEKEEQTALLLHPFCYMEANSFFEQKYTALQALDEMHYYFNEVKRVEGTLISIWHNTFLGTAPLFNGWRELYAQFTREAAS